MKLFKTILLILIFYYNTTTNASITNKILVSVGKEIITEYDVAEEIVFLKIFSEKKIERLKKKEIEKIAVNTIVDEKIKLNALSLYPQIFIKENQVNNYLTQISKSVNIENVEDLKIFFKQKEYNYEKFIKKIELELKWNQLIYQLNKNNIIIDKEKIDKKVEQIILNQKQEEYLISEIFIESSNMEELEIKSSEAIKNIEIDGFGNTAIKFSSSPSAMTGGKLGWVSKDEISDYLLNYIKKTDIGKVTERIYVSKGVIIFKIEDKRFVEKKIDIEKKISELVESEKNEQLMQFSSSFFNQVKNNIVIKYFNE